MNARHREWVALYAGSVACALLLSAVLVEATGGSWRPVLDALIDGSFRGPGRWGQTLGAAAPMLLVALGTIVSARAGLVNIGQEGQLLIGVAFAVFVGFRIGGPGPVNILIAVSYTHLVFAAGPADICDRDDGIDWTGSIVFDGGRYAAQALRLIIAGELGEGSTYQFPTEAGLNGAELCDPSPETEAALADAFGLLASFDDDLMGQLGAISGEAYSGE